MQVTPILRPKEISVLQLEGYGGFSLKILNKKVDETRTMLHGTRDTMKLLKTVIKH